MKLTVVLLQKRGYKAEHGTIDYFKAELVDSGETIYLMREIFEDPHIGTVWTHSSKFSFTTDDSPIITLGRAKESIEI